MNKIIIISCLFLLSGCYAFYNPIKRGAQITISAYYKDSSCTCFKNSKAIIPKDWDHLDTILFREFYPYDKLEWSCILTEGPKVDAGASWTQFGTNKSKIILSSPYYDSASFIVDFSLGKKKPVLVLDHSCNVEVRHHMYDHNLIYEICVIMNPNASEKKHGVRLVPHTETKN